jgi:L-threonylcarbamoyladenylate synthase
LKAHTRSHIRAIRPQEPDPDLIRSAVEVLEGGGVVVYPTRCIYGLGADARRPAAVARIYTLKRRAPTKPLLVLVPDVDAVTALARRVPPAAATIMKRFWPGKITLVFAAADALPPVVTAGSGKIGIRLPGHPVASALVRALGAPLTGTSANLSGRPGCREVRQLPPELLDGVDWVLDAGPLKGGIGSTVVDVTAAVPVILREGAVSRSELESVLRVR